MNYKITMVCRLALIPIAWLFLHCLWITYDGMQPFTGKADVAIILGNAVRDNGCLSPVLLVRVDEALDLYRNRQVKKIFASGGIGENRIPEGNAMKTWLVQQGVNSNDVIVDNNGINTYFTARDFIEANKYNNYHSAVVISSFYHIPRSKYILKKLGYKDNVYSASSGTVLWNDWVGLVRDCIAFYKYLIVY